MNKFWLALVLLMSSATSALGGELPFVLPDHRKHENIPSGMGAEFFYGVWTGVTANEHVTLRITPDTIELVTTISADRSYRVVAEAPNYVLILVKITAFGSIWNSFHVLTYTPDWFGYGPKSAYPYMAEHSCNSFSGSGGGDALNWSQEKIEAVFKQSNCLKDMVFTGHSSVSGNGWSRSTYKYDKQNSPKEQ